MSLLKKLPSTSAGWIAFACGVYAIVGLGFSAFLSAPEIRYQNPADWKSVSAEDRRGAAYRAEISATIYLLGDGGIPLESDPTLARFSKSLADDSKHHPTLALFLGDNIYPSGLPSKSHPEYAAFARRLEIQAEAIWRAGARGIFVPGNHDWDRSGPEGLSRVENAARFLAEHRLNQPTSPNGIAPVRWLPAHGTSGPAKVEEVGNVALILIDSEWFLRSKLPKRPAPANQAYRATGAAIAEARKSSKIPIVAMHHPLLSNGRHAGYVEPLEYAWPPFYRAFYKMYQTLAPHSSDMQHPLYGRYIAELSEIFKEVPPDLVASGHDHSLQMLQSGDGWTQIVSGTGAGDGHKVTSAGLNPQSIFAAALRGFAVIDAFKDGTSKIYFVTIEKDGRLLADGRWQAYVGQKPPKKR